MSLWTLRGKCASSAREELHSIDRNGQSLVSIIRVIIFMGADGQRVHARHCRRATDNTRGVINRQSIWHGSGVSKPRAKSRRSVGSRYRIYERYPYGSSGCGSRRNGGICGMGLSDGYRIGLGARSRCVGGAQGRWIGTDGSWDSGNDSGRRVH